jgi:hypothetical protein
MIIGNIELLDWDVDYGDVAWARIDSTTFLWYVIVIRDFKKRRVIFNYELDCLNDIFSCEDRDVEKVKQEVDQFLERYNKMRAFQ